ncbi:phosphatase PAP2 family protein [Muricauda sp. SCSIO 64092]|uniref:phosphatase PAP2 family protein n=1 Tax=Allomuricauda sp. SCSIO 64092 TaxID=2908842 RepID=UPI001FF4E158|nr:phosphatase PAP2 family protein [Muricauda sp. SCSIO 64092]UOY07503.1 phosphatase PAP2 family protein [Muricauda sp. SCSIO 64092]
MWDKLLQWDKGILIFLNNLGIEAYDGFWSAVTEIRTWFPLFLFFILLLFWKYPKREAFFQVMTLIFLAIFITFITHWAKVSFARLRPSNDLEINTLIRVLRTPRDYSFFSGHASSSFSITVLMFLFIRRTWKWAFFFFLWPILFCASRIYLGVHYPSDIIVGAAVGTLFALVFYRLYQYVIVPYTGLDRP